MDPVLTRVDLRGHRSGDWSGLDSLEPGGSDDVERSVASVIVEVRADGDAALRRLTARFDGVEVGEIEVPASEIEAAEEKISPELRSAMLLAADQIRAYHDKQVPREVTHTSRGISVVDVTRPVERAGCYVPGGLAVYPSTVLMTVVPARVAGVGEVIVCVPPARDGEVPSATLAAASIAGADRVMRIGGAQAIAAMAYGTESVPAVDVIVGPGNRYVAEAKRQVFGRVGIDSLAGPSEVVIVASDEADPEIVAADLLAQAEHGPGGGAVVITWDEKLGDAVEEALADQLGRLDRRDEAESTLASGGRLVLVDDARSAADAVNHVAPEHLELIGEQAESLVEHIANAGAVFVGPYSSAVVGDYVAGTNHVLPTGRTARFASSLGVDTFRKHFHVVEVERDALAALEPALTALATAEGLTAHREAVLRRVRREGST